MLFCVIKSNQITSVAKNLAFAGSNLIATVKVLKTVFSNKITSLLLTVIKVSIASISKLVNYIFT